MPYMDPLVHSDGIKYRKNPVQITRIRTNLENTGIVAIISCPTPWRINMEHNHGGLEDHFPF